MNVIRVVAGKCSNWQRTRWIRGRAVRWAVLAAALWIGLSPLAAQTVRRSTGLIRTTTTSDPNTALRKDPNATSDKGLVSDPNLTPISDPNRTPVSEPNETPVVDPNKAPVQEPNNVPPAEPNSGQFNKSGNILIADRLNHRVIEVERDTHAIVWQFGDGNSVAGPKSVVAPSDAERVGEWTLICGASVSTSTDPNAEKGLGDHRVLLVDPSGKIFWQYGQAGVAGSDVNQLNTPVCATFLSYGHILICDQGNHRVIEVSMVTKTIVWQHGTTGTSGTGPNHLYSPSSAQLLDNGNILIADAGNNWVIEVSRKHRTVWQYGNSNSDKSLNGPSFACRRENGNTLITDSGNNRILEIDRRGRTVLEFVTSKQSGSVADPLATRAVRLDNGNTLISDQFNHQVIEIDSGSNVVFTQGNIGTPGNGSNQLNCPCDAKAIGDYTGLTPPSLDSYCDWSEDREPPPDRDRYDWAHNRVWRR